MTKVLVVDDEPNILLSLEFLMEQAGFSVTTAEDGETALQRINDTEPDLVLLDISLPGISGFDVLEQLRQDARFIRLPVIMLTAHGREVEREKGMALGADDYITKPFSPRELVARLKAVLRRATPVDSESPIEIGGLLLDPVSHRVTIDGKPAEMGPTEYRLLQFFMTHQERAYTRSQLLDQVWGGNVYVEERTVDVHIRRLRKALGEAYENLVQTVRGTGYRFSSKS